MHPPEFNPNHRLSDWPGCVLELECNAAAHEFHRAYRPLRLMLQEVGNPTFADLLRHLVCSKCGSPPAPVYLIAGHHRTFCYGPRPDWSLELVPPLNSRPARDNHGR